MTGTGLLVTLVFLGSYVAMTVTATQHGARARVVQWGCWLLACGTMLVCHLAAPSTAG